MTPSEPVRRLLLARHGESEGNRQGIFTGWLDLPLTARGRDEASEAGRRLRDGGLTVGAAFTSTLVRAQTSCALMLAAAGLGELVPKSSAALNERDYGDLAGMSKEAARDRWGPAQVQEWRRSYAVAPPGGESLRDAAARVLPYYIRHVLPAAMSGGALIVAHGNSLRAIVMALDGLTVTEVEQLEIGTSEIIVYNLDANAGIAGRRILPPARP